MPKHRRLKYRELVRLLKPHGIKVIVSRGKGSERMLYDPKRKLNYPIKHHGDNQELSIGMLKAIKRKFNLPDDFLF